MNIGIIPARYASTRFPGKPLVDIHGKSMIQRVYEQCIKAKLDRVVVATDDDRIFEHVQKFGGEAIMTANTHKSGTDRIAEAAKTLHLTDEDIVLNIQGDEPFIDPEDIQLLGTCFEDKRTEIATLVKKIGDLETLNNPNSPKVVLGINQQALYFSREAIPHIKGIDKENWLSKRTFFQHIGIYAFRYVILKEITALSASPLEQSEGLEQLRWIENGYTIQTAEISSECIAVDCPEDLKRIDNKFFS
jgi:3-deoxy-manno-octulosonate cytidylyltransferase (CMP-KDO synthetase)